jgi:Ca-activated chloride channel family protein
MSRSSKPNLEVIPLKEKAPLKGASEMDFLVRITAPERPIERARPQLNLGLVLDRSGSMSGRKIERAREAACYCVDQLVETDRISITIFDDGVDVIVPSVPAQDRRRIKEKIRGIESGGSTALHEAWVTGARQVAEHVDKRSLNRLLLITDGLANVGVTDPEVIVSQAKGLYERGIATSTIGVGNDFNEDLLVAMANGAGGNSWFVESPEDFQRIFETEMEGLLRETCSKIAMRIEPAEGVELLDVLNDFERTPDGSFSLPGLLAGEPLDIVVRVKLPGGAPGRFHCFKMLMEWSEHGSGKRLSMEGSAGITYAPEKEADGLSPNPEVEKVVSLLEGARLKRKAMEYMDRGDYARASRSLREQSQKLSALAAATGDESIAAEVQALDALYQNLEEQKDLSHTRKSMSYQSSYAQRGRREKKGSSDKK